jgi:hypothetical protein
VRRKPHLGGGAGSTPAFGLFARRQAEAIVRTSTSHDRNPELGFLGGNFSGTGTSSSRPASHRMDGAYWASLCPQTGFRMHDSMIPAIAAPKVTVVQELVGTVAALIVWAGLCGTGNALWR